jgi:HlyD family secretion protein
VFGVLFGGGRGVKDTFRGGFAWLGEGAPPGGGAEVPEGSCPLNEPVGVFEAMPPGKKNARWALIGLVLLLSAGAWMGARWIREPEAGDGAAFQTTAVDRGTITQTIVATGQLKPVVNVEVGSQVSGIIEELYVDFNSPVRAGQVLARLDPATYEANVRQAEAELASAEAALELQQVSADRMRILLDRDLVARSEVDTAQANLKQAEAALRMRQHSLERARSELARCTIYSPIDGIVISRNVDVGQTVAASMTAPVLFVIANDLSEMQIHCSVVEADIGRVETGQRVEFRVDAFPQTTFQGEVIQVRNQPIIDNNVVTYDTVISVQSPGRRLKPGMTANVSIVTAEEPDVLRLRNAALRTRLPDAIRPADPADVPPGTRVVYRLGEAAGLEPVPVETGITDGVFTRVVRGLDEGDTIVTGMALRRNEEDRRGSRPSVFGPRPAEF